MSALRIVPATTAHIPVILELIRALADYEKLAHIVTATEDRLRDTLFGARVSASVLLAYRESECAGLAVFFETYSTFRAQPGLYLEDLYIRPHLRGVGIGLALLKEVARTATQRGCGRVEWGVLDWNESAIEFYERLGARPMTGWTKYRLEGKALETLGRPDL